MVPINDGNHSRANDVVFVVLNLLFWCVLALTIWSTYPR
jgi:hypothetical protein